MYLHELRLCNGMLVYVWADSEAKAIQFYGDWLDPHCDLGLLWSPPVAYARLARYPLDASAQTLPRTAA